MRYVNNLIILVISGSLFWSCSEQSSSHNTTGQGGSTARYAIQGDYLYVINDLSLHVYSIAASNFQEINVIEVGFGVETITTKPGFLYLGANDGMHIYDLENPEYPNFLFQYAHILSCDPVVVQGNRAYLTLSTGASCGNRAINALEIIDISNPHSPNLIKQYPMSSPRGLSVDADVLFVAEGKNGFMVFDISDELNIRVVGSSKVPALDVIAGAGLLTVTGNDGIFQYQYSDGDPNQLSLLSKIPVVK
jgi:hypothetical protein